jgi:riboflavin kinase/FMN adenylyltransferase
MRVHRGIDHLGEIRKAVVSTGSFDGVHYGHKVLLKRLGSIANEIGGESVLITFYPHPRKVLYPDSAGKDLKLINTQREKIKLLEKTGLDHLIIIPFTLEFSRISSIDFIRKILVEKIKAACIVVGFNHHFGHNREGSFEYLYELGKYYGFQVEEILEQDIENEAVSSTRIRKALKEGHIQRANAYLNHHYLVMGMLEPGRAFFTDKGFDTSAMHIEEEEKLLPPPGIYASGAAIGSEYVKALVIIHKIPGEYGPCKARAVDILFQDSGIHWEGLDVRLQFRKTLWLGEIAREEQAAKLIHKMLASLNELIY